jgi:hypothetical protein
MLDEASNRYLKQINGYLLVEVGRGTVTEVAEIYRSLAYVCVKQQLKRVLVKAADDDAAGERALRDCFATMLLAGIPSDFRLALVAATVQIGARYRLAQHDLALVKVDAKIFDSEEDAVRWLGESGGRVARAAA